MMTVSSVTADEYYSIFTTGLHAYNSRRFTEFNAGKCDDIKFLVFSIDSKPRLGLVAGVRQGQLLSPFSAPFGGFDVKRPMRVDAVIEAIEALKAYLTTSDETLALSMPPMFYQPQIIPQVVAAMVNDPAVKTVVEYNYHFDCHSFTDYYSYLSRAARKNLNNALRHDWRFDLISADDADGVARAYEVIRLNREQHGYPLRMTLEAVRQTVKIIPAEFFVLSLGGHDVAAAQVFYPADRIAQVIYWGDVEGYSDKRPMNMLAYRLFGHLTEKADIVDVGPSSTDGIPSPGLCEFKESVGCHLTPKFRFTILV